MDTKKKILYSVDLGFFLSGIFLILLSDSNSKIIGVRAIVGEIAVLSSYFLFPFIDYQKKEDIYLKLLLHVLLFIVSIVGAYFSLKIYVNYADGAIWWKEILAAVGIIAVIVYWSYLLISFVRALYVLSAKLIAFLINSDVESKYENSKKIIEKITAFIVSITALATSITALIASLKKITGS